MNQWRATYIYILFDTKSKGEWHPMHPSDSTSKVRATVRPLSAGVLRAKIEAPSLTRRSYNEGAKESME